MEMTNRRRWMLLVLLVMSLALPVPVAAQNPIGVLDQGVETAFRDHITFSISLESASEITDVRLFYRVTGQLATARGDADFEPGTQVEASFTIDQERDYLPPGTELEYWWKITNATDDTLKTDPETLLYMDERHNWQTLISDRLTLYWYDGDRNFGEALFDQANKTLDQIETEAGVQVEMPMKIFIYGSYSDLHDAIAVGSQEWTGGQAFTEQGVVVIGVAPGELDYGLAATPHELTHLVIHQATDNPFGDIPRWLDEGLSVYMSGELDMDWRGYRADIARGAKQNNLMTLQTLSSTFPADSEQAGLAYAQSGAVVEFIIDHYDKDAMAHLLEIFSEGALYNDALEQALGVDTWELDNAWRQSINASLLEIPASTQEIISPTSEPATAPTEEAAPATTEELPAPTGGGQTIPCLGSSLTGAAVLALFMLFRARGAGVG